jgi:hypothetical protein
MADFDLGGLLGNMFGGGDSELEKLLTAKQKEQLGLQSSLAAAAALLQASGRGPQRIGLGQALGSALQAGQGAYERGTTNAFQQMLLGQRIKEMQQEALANEAYRSQFTGAAETPLTPAQAALAAPISAAGSVGPPIARAELPAQMPASTAAPGIVSSLNPEMRRILGGMTRKEGQPELLKIGMAQTEFGKPESMVIGGKPVMVQFNKLGQSRVVEGVSSIAEAEFGEGRPEVRDGKTVMVQYNKLGQSRIAEGAAPYEALPTDVRAPEYLIGRSLAGTGQEGIGIVSKYRQDIAPKTNVNVPDMTGGQKGFENEMKLSSAFKQEPIYKDYSDMKSSFGQVVSSLSQGTPIGDVAGATKVMKLLDPGSVVRETELGIAMAAAGRMDRLNNYFNNMMTGQKLTPTQRDDFKALANELYAAAGDAYNKKRGEYRGFGEAYNFKNLDTALGAPATIPSVMRTRPGAAGGGGARPSLSNIFGVPGG